jgi:hypothetical protein
MLNIYFYASFWIFAFKSFILKDYKQQGVVLKWERRLKVM